MPQQFPLRTPAQVRGPSLRDLHQQRKADEEVKDLLASDSAVAGGAAFAKGFAAGAVLPAVLGGLVPWASNVPSTTSATYSQVQLAELLKERGIPKEQASHHAATVYRYLENHKKQPAQEALDVLSPSTKTYAIPVEGFEKTRFPTMEAAEDAYRAAREIEGMPAEEIKRKLRAGAVQELPARKLVAGLYPAQISNILDDAAAAFKKRTTSAVPAFAKAHGMLAARNLGKGLAMAGMVGLPVGIANYLRHRRRRKTLEALRTEQRRRSFYAR